MENNDPSILGKFFAVLRGRVKEKLGQLPCEQFLQAFEIHRALLRAKQVGEERWKIQNPVIITHKVVVLIFLSL